jgi:transposase
VKSRKVYPTDVSDEEWEFVAPYLTLMKEDAPQRLYALRDLFDAVRKDGEGGLSVAVAAR